MAKTAPQLHRRVMPSPAPVLDASLHPLVRRLYALRGLSAEQVDHTRLRALENPDRLGSVRAAAILLAEAIEKGWKITVAGDYDCDGATGSAVAVLGLRMLGALHVNFAIPDRLKHGYGLSRGLVESMDPKPDLIVTVDSGVASFEGVDYAKSLGIKVLVTDHHLPGDHLPNADVIVNPNLHGDEFPSKALAGVGVMFYVLLALRQRLREAGQWSEREEPDLTVLLDRVALGTIADLVPLDLNNRVLVHAGLRRIRAGLGCAGIQALAAVSGRDITHLTASDIGFAIAPRLNAAGRLENMSIGVETLMATDLSTAKALAQQLDDINQDRKQRQQEMVDQAEQLVEGMIATPAVGVVVYDPSWHSGIVGLVASKLKENLHRPVFALAPAGDGTEILRGSGRSIDGFHLRDALVLLDVRNPGMVLKFGGHAMAAGLSLHSKDVAAFTEAFDAIARELLTQDKLQRLIYSDGQLTAEELNLDTVLLLEQAGPWGQGFAEPVFDNVFECIGWSVLGEKHIQMDVRLPNTDAVHRAIWFFADLEEPLPPLVWLAYKLSVNRYKGREGMQLLIESFISQP